jgi:flagellin
MGSESEMTDVGSLVTSSLASLSDSSSDDEWQAVFEDLSTAIDNAIDYISTQRAVYGSQINRLSFMTTNLQANSTNLQNSRSSIIDTDFAAETAALTKGQIMQQAATAMLAQANQMPNVILSLLK